MDLGRCLARRAGRRVVVVGFCSPGGAHKQPDAAALRVHHKSAVGTERARAKRDRALWRGSGVFGVPFGFMFLLGN